MKKRKQKQILRTTLRQRKRLDSIRFGLAEQGFQIFPVALRYRRHERDFVAVARENPQKMLLIRPGSKGVVEVRPYQHRSAYNSVWFKIQGGRTRVAGIQWGRKLPAKDNREGWRAFIAKSCSLELKLFTNSN